MCKRSYFPANLTRFWSGHVFWKYENLHAVLSKQMYIFFFYDWKYNMIRFLDQMETQEKNPSPGWDDDFFS